MPRSKEQVWVGITRKLYGDASVANGSLGGFSCGISRGVIFRAFSAADC